MSTRRDPSRSTSRKPRNPSRPSHLATCSSWSSSCTLCCVALICLSQSPCILGILLWHRILVFSDVRAGYVNLFHCRVQCGYACARVAPPHVPVLVRAHHLQVQRASLRWPRLICGLLQHLARDWMVLLECSTLLQYTIFDPLESLWRSLLWSLRSTSRWLTRHSSFSVHTMIRRRPSLLPLGRHVHDLPPKLCNWCLRVLSACLSVRGLAGSACHISCDSSCWPLDHPREYWVAWLDSCVQSLLQCIL